MLKAERRASQTAAALDEARARDAGAQSSVTQVRGRAWARGPRGREGRVRPGFQQRVRGRTTFAADHAETT